MAATDSTEWTEQKIIELIREYRKHRALWDPKHPSFFKKNLKPETWNEIGRTLSIPADACRHKLAIMLSSFRREKSRIAHSIRAKEKDPKKPLYRSSWFAFRELAFLIDKETERERQKTGLQDSDDSEDVDYANRVVGQITTEGTRIQIAPSMCKSIVDMYTDKEAEPSPSQEPSPCGFKLHSRSKKSLDDDEINFFTNFVATKMRKYSEGTRSAVQQAICEVIFNADRNAYEPPRTSISSTNDSNIHYEMDTDTLVIKEHFSDSE